MISEAIEQKSKSCNALRNTRSAAQTSANPNDIAEQLIARNYLSWSSISTFLRCPKRFRLQYIDRVEQDFVSSNLVFGSCIHAAIESIYRALFVGAESPEHNELMSIYDTAWKQEQKPVRFGRNETAETLRDLAGRMLDAFLAHPEQMPDGELIGVEEELRGAIVENAPDILGRIDLIVRTKDAIRLVDFKTSKSSWSASKIDEAAPQMLLYSELAKPIAESYGLPVEVSWVVLTKHKQPRIEVHNLTPAHDRVKATKAMVREVWRAIQERFQYPIASAMNCSTCPYRGLCPAWEGTT